MSSTQDTLGIYAGLTRATLFRYDYNTDKLTHMDLNKYFEGKQFKLKILDLKGVDMCLEDKDFISDIAFTEENREFIKRLKAEELKSLNRWSKKTLKSVNYDDEENWTLTYRLRGYEVEFDDTPMDVLDSYLPKLIKFIYNQHRAKAMYSSFDERENGFEDYLNNNTYSSSYLLYNRDDDKEESVESDESEDEWSENDSYYYECDEKPISRSNYDPGHAVAISKILLSTSNWLYVEYSEVSRLSGPINVVEKKFKKTDIFELRFNGGNLFGRLFELSVYTSPNLTDYDMHSDEGAYAAGVNKYDGGLVLIGEQNSNVMYYGNANEYDILIPDYFLPIPTTKKGYMMIR